MVEARSIGDIRLITLKAALKLELRGMMRSRKPSAYKMLKDLGYKGSRETVLAAVEKDIAILLGRGDE